MHMDVSWDASGNHVLNAGLMQKAKRETCLRVLYTSQKTFRSFLFAMCMYILPIYICMWMCMWGLQEGSPSKAILGRCSDIVQCVFGMF